MRKNFLIAAWIDCTIRLRTNRTTTTAISLSNAARLNMAPPSERVGSGQWAVGGPAPFAARCPLPTAHYPLFEIQPDPSARGMGFDLFQNFNGQRQRAAAFGSADRGRGSRLNGRDKRFDFH